MTVPAEVTHKHTNDLPVLRVLQDKVKGTILSHTEKKGFAFVGRLKDPTSIAEKIETGRFKTWSKLEDPYGCSIIFPTLQDEAESLSFIRENFSVIEVKQRGNSQIDPAVFRFDSTRVLAKLDYTREGLSPDAPIVKIPFEIQLRTAFEHAWSVTTHKTVYKGNRIDWRYIRLSAQLKAAVEQLDLMISGYGSIADIMQIQKWPEFEIKSKIDSAFAPRFEDGRIPAEIKPFSWVRFCDNFYSIIKESAKLGVPKKTALDVSTDFLETICTEFDKMSAGEFPRSLTFIQICIGILSEKSKLPSLQKYCAPVTVALRDIYPSTQRISNSFDYETI